MRAVYKLRLSRLLVVLGCWAGAASELGADPLTFHGTWFLVNSSPERLDLFSNPGVLLEARTYGGTLPLSFSFGTLVDHAGGESFTDTIRFTYLEQGAMPVVFSQTFTTGTDPIRLGFVTLFEPIARIGRPIPTTLTVELLNSAPDFMIPGDGLVDSYTYSFETQSPVPEPSTMLLVISGGTVAWRRARRRFRASRAANRKADLTNESADCPV